MRIRPGLSIGGSVVVGFVVGATLTLSVQSAGRTPGPAAGPSSPIDVVPPVVEREPPDTFLAWTPGGLPPGFRRALDDVPLVRRDVVVASDVAWLARSSSSSGEIVDDPPQGFSIPLEVAAVDPREYGAFLPPADRSVLADLADGYGVLGESSARLRELGPGSVLRFGDVDVRITAVLPDELVGANELLVSRSRADALGVAHDRYALIQPRGSATERTIRRALASIVPPELPVQVRAPGETPYFRQGDAVLPPVQIKLLFGEFAAAPDPNRPGYLRIDPAWEQTHIATERMPILGDVTCNVALFPQLRAALRTLVRRGLQHTITSYSGCYARRFANRDPSQAISHHTWAIAVDVNVPQNPYGATPHQDPRLVRVFERSGFIWGGRFVRPDGMHFEYRRAPMTR
jgi:D-alanyl-D-alanine carboxypeptidase